jgi:hypothetical protein
MIAITEDGSIELKANKQYVITGKHTLEHSNRKFTTETLSAENAQQVVRLCNVNLIQIISIEEVE